MTTPPEDVAAMFDLPPESPQPAESTTQAEEAAEAALAAELALTLESGGVAADAPDSRTALRLEVSWPARMQLPDGRIVELEVRNISESGVGLMSGEQVPADTLVDFQMAVPQPGDASKITPVKGTIKTTYSVAHGSRSLCGGTWQAPPTGLELVTLWIERLRR